MTAEPALPGPLGRTASLFRRVLTLPLAALATLVVLFDDLVRSVVKPAAAWLASLEPVRRIEAFVAGLPPYPTLALFLIPMAVIWPISSTPSTSSASATSPGARSPSWPPRWWGLASPSASSP